jgi:hypothetical protein
MKKTVLFLALIICSIFILPLVAEKPLTVVDYYNAISGDKLTLQKGEWVSTRQIEAMGHTFQYNPGVVDIKNGYIEFSHGGGGGNTEKYVLFLKKDGTPIMGYYSENSNDGVCDFDSSIEFKQKNDGKWTNVTSKIIPKIDITLFLKKNYDKNKYNDNVLSIVKKHAKFIYDLPQHGLKVRIWLRASSVERTICRQSLDKSEQSVLQNIKDMDIFRQREMTWEIESGAFKLQD